jgi:PEP-CTERM motif-containing protein
MRLVLLLVLLLVAPAGALTIQIDSVSLGASNTADSANNVSAAQILTASDTVPDVAGGPFADVDARWAGSVFANDTSASATANWQITFTVIANPGVVYDLVILQELAGAFTIVDDSPGSGSGTVGELTGTLNGLPNPLLTMPVGVDSTATSTATVSVPFQRSRILELDALVGTQTFTLAFNFAIDAQSTLDQIAVQLGLPGGIAAAAYPGVGDRDASADGHHLSLSTRVILAPVPEPGTFALVSLGLVALAARGRTRCR